MKKLTIALAILLRALQTVSPAVPQSKLERGKDFIEVPAISDGLCLHNLFQSAMVLQRDKPIRIWGWAAPGESVTVSFAGQTQTAKAAEDRSWKVTFPAMPANAAPQEIVVKGKDETLTLRNILIGDVWVLGGQSNMEFPIEKADNGDLEVGSANFPNIRFLTVPQQNGPDDKLSFPRWYQWSDWSNTHHRQGYWDVCSPETVRNMSAIGYVFARRIHMATQVPIGIINVSRGGTCIETWLPLDLLKSTNTPEVRAKLAEWDQKIAEFNPENDLKERVRHFNDRTAQMKGKGQDVSGRTPPSDLRPGPAFDMNRPGTHPEKTIWLPLTAFDDIETKSDDIVELTAIRAGRTSTGSEACRCDNIAAQQACYLEMALNWNCGGRRPGCNHAAHGSRNAKTTCASRCRHRAAHRYLGSRLGRGCRGASRG